MTNWIEHNGGPQPVGDDVWVDRLDGGFGLAGFLEWSKSTSYRILNQHLIDAKQAEIDALRDDLETWQSVFPHVMPERLKSNQQLAEEAVAAKIGAARLEGIRLGLEAASTEAVHWVSFLMEGRVTRAIRALNPETIAREAQDMGNEKEA